MSLMPATFNISVCTVIAAMLLLLPGCASMQASDTNTPPQLKVVGTNICNRKGEPILLRGVNVASMEWSSDGQGRVPRTVDVAIHDWHVNVIRLPLSQDRWFGYGPEQRDGG